MCAIDNDDQVIINTNDCPFQIAETSASKIKNYYKKINFLLFGYSSATAYPQCFELSDDELQKSQEEIVKKFLSQGESYINFFKGRAALLWIFWIIDREFASSIIRNIFYFFNGA